MLPFNKAQWFLGYSNLAMIMEQDRRHWLLRTDKLKQTQDARTGSMYLGQIDNQGSYINISTEKSDIQYPIIFNSLVGDKMNKILQLETAVLPFTYEVNGLSCARIISTQYPYSTESGGNKNFKIRFSDCEVVGLPFSVGDGKELYRFQFLKTSTAPTIVMLDNDGNYTITVDVNISLTNVVFYYPLDTFQPIEIEDLGNGTYETLLIDDDTMIGYPGFWFVCDETKTGPEFSIDGLGKVAFEYGNQKDDMYHPFCFVMDKFRSSDTEYLCVYPEEGYTFVGDATDFDVPVDVDKLYLITTDGGPGGTVLTERLVITTAPGTRMYMVKGSEGHTWTRVSTVSGYSYQVKLNSFNSNYTTPSTPLIPALMIQLDNNVPFEKTTYDTGYAGIDITANSQSGEFPHKLNLWDGLPEHLTQNTDATQRVVIYAIHNTPNSSPEVPESRQTAALILDPGVPITGTEETFSEDEKGRVYVISNDPAEYVNNGMTEYPKPGRTLARICDIPVSVMQLANITGLAPTPIVDPKYVRSAASYKESEQNRLYNDLADKWVRPIHLNRDGVSIIDAYETETNEFVFNDISHLEAVDLFNYNDFRVHTQLNELVDPTDVSLYLINDGGSNYAINDIGTIIVGGFAFDYVVTEVDASGSVTDLEIYPSTTWMINIANFDMMPETDGITQRYGTSPRGSSQGTGLKIQFQIDNYQTKIPSRGNVYDGLYAFVRRYNGLWLYAYNTTTNKWEETQLISQYEETIPGIASTKDSYINSILPNINNLPVAVKSEGVSETSIKVINTASFINIIDQDKTPIYDANPVTQKTIVDINKFYCHSIRRDTAKSKVFASILERIRELNLDRFDSYIIWRWVNETSAASREFEFGIVHRSLNNLQSTDVTSNLPENELKSKNYVHTNASTTISWHVENFGPMVWTFNPESHIYEKYLIDQNTRELYVERSNLTWKDVEVYTDNFQTKVDLIDSNGNLLWNIAANAMRYQDSQTPREPIYQQPDYVSKVAKGTNVETLPVYQPTGTWELVFPHTQTFTFRNDASGTEYNPTQMQVIRTTAIQPTTDVLDIYGNPVNYRTIVVNDTEDGSEFKVYNHETERWENV